jgi:hypothetical protein
MDTESLSILVRDAESMGKFPELLALEKTLAWREYKVDVVERTNYTILTLSRENNVLDQFAFKDIEDCGFTFAEVLLENGLIEAIFHRNEENRFPDLA